MWKREKLSLIEEDLLAADSVVALSHGDILALLALPDVSLDLLRRAARRELAQESYQALLNSYTPGVAEIILANPHAGVDVTMQCIEYLGDDLAPRHGDLVVTHRSESAVEAALRTRTSADPEVWQAIATLWNPHVERALSTRTDLPEEAVRNLAASTTSIDVLVNLVKNPSISYQSLYGVPTTLNRAPRLGMTPRQLLAVSGALVESGLVEGQELSRLVESMANYVGELATAEAGIWDKPLLTVSDVYAAPESRHRL